MRVAAVWMDDYKEYFYADKPHLKGKPFGEIEEQVKFRRKHCPRTFNWFMHNIAFDTLEKYPPPAPNKLWGEVSILLILFQCKYCTHVFRKESWQ